MKFKNNLRLSEEQIDELWKEAIFVFDTSAILDFYLLTKTQREAIYNDVFPKLAKRLWVPDHVKFEYSKNRIKSIGKPIEEKYAPLKSTVRSLKHKADSEILRTFNIIKEGTRDSNIHPHLDQVYFNEFDHILDKFIKDLERFKINLLKQIKAVSDEVSSTKDNDDVLNALEANFEVGREYSFEEIISISLEGKHRYEFKIPPGYGDLYSTEKKGTQIFGDLIIWKQILEFSKEKGSSIIFITNDVAKDEDWCYTNKKNNEIISPREELIKEIRDHSKVNFWMYNLSQFISNSNKYLDASIEYTTIQYINQALSQKRKEFNFTTFINLNNEQKVEYLFKYRKIEMHDQFDSYLGQLAYDELLYKTEELRYDESNPGLYIDSIGFENTKERVSDFNTYTIKYIDKDKAVIECRVHFNYEATITLLNSNETSNNPVEVKQKILYNNNIPFEFELKLNPIDENDYVFSLTSVNNDLPLEVYNKGLKIPVI
ncbi:PIN-like domain-containing protein [Rufibacter sediminis]|uniref:DUF4935 domain-containing protein n=1 Tax=Rufibacter sediminis TaxID=2762756 RepID=A0ABR6VW63_9BACT|nr:PIN-like domain-containing protein [Rufibacter sediminis]MBC3541394.1 DUF4935 domain-containing protein [Rufibacter sediminis]